MMTLNVFTSRSRRRYLAVFGALSLLFSLVAQTGFGISPASAEHLLEVGFTLDQQGPDDPDGTPANTDLSSMAFDDSHVDDTGIVYVTWNYDDTRFTSGAMSTCALFDTDADGGVNFALCTDVGYDGDPAEPNTGVIRDVDLWDCTDVTASPLNCTGGGGAGNDNSAGELGDKDNDGINDFAAAGSSNKEYWVTSAAPGYDTTCTLSVGPDPFASSAAHQANDTEAPDADNDLVILCEVHVSDFVELTSLTPGTPAPPVPPRVPATANLTNVCSYPATSGSPSSNAKDCIVSGGAGFITVVKKVAEPQAADASFSFTLNANPFATLTVVAGETEETTGAKPVASGTYNLAEVVPAGWQLDTATCEDGSPPGTLTVSRGERVTCTFSNSLSLQPPDISLVKTANPTSLDEPGGIVTFTVEITNNGGEGTIESLADNIHGDLAASCVDGDAAALVGQTIGEGETLTCTFTATVNGIPGESETDTVTGVVSNAVGDSTASDDAVVTIDDVPSSITVVKTADPVSVDEPGGNVTFSFVVSNTSAVDSVTINTLSDTVYGDLNDQGDCSVPQNIAAGGSYSCSFTASVGGNAGATHTNVVTASGLDDDGQPVSDDDDATVTVNDVPSSIEVIKTANPISIAENGGFVTYTFTVNNTSATDFITITSLEDSIYGDLNGQGGCETPQAMIAPATGYSCSITVPVTGNAGDVITNVLTVAGVDDDDGPVAGSDDAVVTIDDVPSSIEVIKTANPTSIPENGGDVTYAFTVNNTSATDSVTIDSLLDSIYGDLDGQGDCSVGALLAPTESYSCSITATVSGSPDDLIKNVLTVAGTDDDGNPVGGTDDAEVTITDLPSSIEVIKTANPASVPETGGDVTFTVTVENTSAADSVTINTVVDDLFGDVSSSCAPALPAALAPGESITCTFSEFLSGDTGTPHTNVATASGKDDDGNPVSDDDDEDVTFDDVLGSIEVIKTASPSSVDEPGGDVTFSFVVNNTSAVDSVTIDTLDDTIYGDLNGQGDCSVPQTIAVAGSYNCSFAVFVAGNAGDTETNVVTASGLDDDDQPVSDDDDATVTIDDVPSSILTTKTANPTSVPETGGDVEFTITVENTSLVDDVTINEVDDSEFGDVSDSCAPALPALLAPGELVTCTFTEFISGDAPGSHINVATATGEDDDGNLVSDDGEEEVPFEDVLPDISVLKSASVPSVPETGGDVEFTFLVTNNATEDATLDSLMDSDFGDLSGQGDCSVPQALAANGGTYTCSVTVNLSGDAGGVHENTVTADASDDDGNSVSAEDDETVLFQDVLPDVSISKTANPTSVPETGGDVEFTVVVTNNSLEDATIDSLVDSDFDLAANCAGAVGTVLASDASYTCTFTEALSGDASGPDHENTATVVASDGDGNTDTESDDETVGYDDVLPVISVTKTANPTAVDEPGADVEFTVVVTNDSDENVTIDSLGDSDFDLAIQCADAVGTVLAPDASYTCTFTETLSGDASGDAHENTVTALASDNEGNDAEASGDATVGFGDVLPDVSITKSANPTSVPETGGDVEFTVVVTNNSLEDAAIDSLGDSVFDLAANCADAVGTVLASEAFYTCTFTEFVSGDFGGPDHENTATVTASDNEGNTDTKSDDATVTFTDVLPDVSITKTANLTSVDEPGADVEFTIVVTNNSLEDATIDSFVDTDFDLAANCAGAVGTVLASGDSYTCTFTEFVAGNPADGNHENTATVVASDNDGNSDTESDDETVVSNDVAPSIAVTKTANQDQVFAPGENVTFTVSVENTSVQSDPITITSLDDDVFGDLAVECALPVTIGSGATFNCIITRNITADHTNTVTVFAVDDEGTLASGEATASVDVINPTLVIEKSTNGFDADSAPGHEILVGAPVTWIYEVTNTGDVALTDILVVDDQLGDICTISSLAAGLTATCEADGIAVADGYSNLATASTTYTDVDGDAAERDDSDPSNYFGAAPSVEITKAFADGSVIAGGTGSSFTLVVTNDGNVDLDAVSISDTVDGDLVVSTVSSGDADCSASADQEVDCLVDLAVGESATVTVNFSVDSATLARSAVNNTANVSDTYTDGSGNSTDIGDDDSDTIDILTDINLSIVKTFAPANVAQGTAQSFTIEVSNAGPSDAVNVSVTDTVNSNLAVTGVTLSSGTGDCSASDAQEVDCTIDSLAVGGTVTITVEYDAAPLLTGTLLDGTDDGSRFKFVFVNGSILEGSANGAVYLDGVAIKAGKTKNDYTFNAPDGSVIDLHLSCSDAFTGGWGDFGGPVEGVDTDWQIASYSIARYKRGEFFRSCEDIVVPLRVTNTATATATDSSGANTVSDDAVVTIGPGLTVDRFQANGKKITVTITNPTGEPKDIEDVTITWPSDNEKLKKVTLDGSTVWTGSVSPESTVLDESDSKWNGGSLPTGESKLRFDFAGKVEKAGYVVTVKFTDGTSLAINN